MHVVVMLLEDLGPCLCRYISSGKCKLIFSHLVIKNILSIKFVENIIPPLAF